jgi:hypothetical protein
MLVALQPSGFSSPCRALPGGAELASQPSITRWVRPAARCRPLPGSAGVLCHEPAGLFPALPDQLRVVPRRYCRSLPCPAGLDGALPGRRHTGGKELAKWKYQQPCGFCAADLAGARLRGLDSNEVIPLLLAGKPVLLLPGNPSWTRVRRCCRSRRPMYCSLPR